MILELASLINSRVERTFILNEITQDNNKVPEDNSKESFEFHRMERSIYESVSTFKSVVEAEKRNGGPQKEQPLAEKENPASMSNQ